MMWTRRPAEGCPVSLGERPPDACPAILVAAKSTASVRLQYLSSTGRHHGYESLAEARLPLVLDFAGELTEVLAQPLR